MHSRLPHLAAHAVEKNLKIFVKLLRRGAWLSYNGSWRMVRVCVCQPSQRRRDTALGDDISLQ
jgi:hypothetical protein